MKINNIIYSNPKQAVLPLLIQDYLDICDPVLTFDRFMGEIELEKYLKNIPQHYTGRLRYDPVSMLKTVLFGFMANGYISLRELEDQCKVNLRFMYLMDHQTPSYRTFGYFINEVLADSIKEIFQDINKKIFETEHVDLQHLYIDGSKFEANANKYSWVWKKATEKSRYRLFDKITTLFEEINEELSCTGIKLCINSEYAPEYLKKATEQYAEAWQIDETMFVHGRGHRKTTQQRHYEKLREYAVKLEEYVEKIKICGEERNSYSKTDHSATFMRIKTDYMGNDQLLPAYNVQVGVADEYIAVVDVNQYRSGDSVMSIVNSWNFTRTVIDWDKFARATHNQYRVVSSRPYKDKKGVLPDGVSLTLQIIKDDFDYGVDKNGNPRENNLFQNFDVTVLNNKIDATKGDMVQLLDFDAEHSYVINFDLLLRFKNAKVVKPNLATQSVVRPHA